MERSERAQRADEALLAFCPIYANAVRKCTLRLYVPKGVWVSTYAMCSSPSHKMGRYINTAAAAAA